LLADFRSDATPLLRLSFDLLGIDHLLDHRQVLRPTLPAAVCLLTPLGLKVSLLQDGGDFCFSRRILRLQ
jgi:hypothetical protein